MNTQTIFPVYETKSLNSDGICRLCGRQDLKVINIFSEEELHNNIPNKIEMYIPSRLLESRELPYACCLQCKSTILSWHNFVIKVLETSQRLSNSANVILTTENNPLDKRVEHIPEVSICVEEGKYLKHELREVREESEQYETITFTSCDKPSEEDETNFVTETPINNASLNNESKKNLELNKPTKHRRKKCEVENRYFCDICDKAFTRKFDMQRHKKLKHKIDDLNSDNRNGNKEILDKCRIVENGKTIYECHICQQRTNQSYNLMRHLSIHTGVKPYVCHICGKSFRLDSSIRKHLKQFHEGVRNYKCDVCDKSFGAKSARDEHLNTHSGLRPFSCDICHKSFKQKSSLYIHKLYHEKNFKFECALCDKKFRRAQELVLHERVHSGLKPYSCDVCDVEFRRSQELKMHKNIHSKKDVEWVCKICESSFTQERYLKLHNTVHVPSS